MKSLWGPLPDSARAHGMAVRTKAVAKSRNVCAGLRPASST